MFHHDLRWKYFKAAAARVDPRSSRSFLDSLEDNEKDLNITEWEIRDVTLSQGGKRAKIRVRLKYFKMPSTVLQDETIEQVWEQKNDAWVLVEQTGGPIEISMPQADESRANPNGDTADTDAGGVSGEKR
ncbi:MAG TPA: hypothetical protein VM425_06935 [Myxococcota bacterium]|nr:hypothetical protein [Myxococcota bacterium]